MEMFNKRNSEGAGQKGYSMAEVRYQTFNREMTAEDGATYQAYGIRALKADAVIMEYADLCVSSEAVDATVSLCNAGGLNPEHLPNILEDFCNNNYSMDWGRGRES